MITTMYVIMQLDHLKPFNHLKKEKILKLQFLVNFLQITLEPN